ncbi:MAG: hypothetical protein U5L96_11715 [Owenweeksia sp.]|nr:hypothetical protein [Owenweeksia sp.]
MLRVVEIAWVVIAIISAIEVYRMWPEIDNKFWIFTGFMVLAVVMFFVRRRQRLRYQERKKQEEQSS